MHANETRWLEYMKKGGSVLLSKLDNKNACIKIDARNTRGERKNIRPNSTSAA